MALKLSDALTECRYNLRHDVDARVDNTMITLALNRAQRRIRSWLQKVSPTEYLRTSDEITPADGDIAMTGDTYTPDNIYKIERLYGDRWLAIEKADELYPEQSCHGRIAFLIEHKCIHLYNTDGCTSPPDGTYRIKFWIVPANLADPNSYFQIPYQCEPALIEYGCANIAMRDGGPNDPDVDKFEARAKAALKEAAEALENREGIHPQQAGLRRIRGR